MKRLFLVAIVGLFLSSCHVHLIGTPSVLSNTPIDTKKEVEVVQKAEFITKRDMVKKKNCYTDMNEAIDAALAKDKTGRGVYLANAKVNLIYKEVPFGYVIMFHVTGDIMGYKQ